MATIQRRSVIRSAVDIEAKVVEAYPDISPYDMDIAPYGITPAIQPRGQFYFPPPYVLSAALKQCKITGLNPFHGIYGTNPFALQPCIRAMHMPVPSQPKPPLLNEMTLEDIRLEEILDDTSSLVRQGENRYILKWVTADACEAGDAATDAFDREREVYSLLLANEAARGITHQCFGWVESAHTEVIKLHPRVSSNTVAKTVKAFVLEHIEGSVPLDVERISIEVAESAMKALAKVHSAFVLHGDIVAKNILLLPDNRVIWSGFGPASRCGSRDELQRHHLWDELAACWTLLYSKMLPDNLIGNFSAKY